MVLNYESITPIFCYGQRSCGYSLSKFPPLLKKIAPNKYEKIII